MKRFFVALLFSVFVLGIQAQQKHISYIKNDGGYYLATPLQARMEDGLGYTIRTARRSA